MIIIIIMIIRRSYHQFPSVSVQVQSVDILAEPLIALLVSTEDVHVVANYGGTVAVPLTRNITLNQRPPPPVGFSTECEEEVTGGLVISTSEQIAGVSLGHDGVTVPLVRPV